MLLPNLKRTWAPQGQTPSCPVWDKQGRVNAFPALAVSPQPKRLALYVQFHRRTLRGEEVVEFLKLLLRHCRGPVVLLWDRGPIHRRQLVPDFLERHDRVHPAYFPAYAPELNPAESVWTRADDALAKGTPRNEQELLLRLRSSMRKLKASQLLLWSCLYASALPWTREPYMSFFLRNSITREVVSLDHLSRGRAILGVGLGAPADAEFQCFGEDPADRVRARKLDEALDILDGLERKESFQHQGEYFHIEEVSFHPRPVQIPRVPIWVAGFWPNKAPLRRAARWDGVFPLKMPPAPPIGLTPSSITWSALWLTPAEVRESITFVRQHRTAEGHFDIVASGATPVNEQAKAREVVAAFQEVGATWWLEWLDEQRGTFAQMREHVRKGPPRI